MRSLVALDPMKGPRHVQHDLGVDCSRGHTLDRRDVDDGARRLEDSVPCHCRGLLLAPLEFLDPSNKWQAGNRPERVGAEDVAPSGQPCDHEHGGVGLVASSHDVVPEAAEEVGEEIAPPPAPKGTART